MSRIYSAVVCFLISFAAFAAEQPKDAPIPDHANMPAIIAFALLFFGLCGYYAWYVYKQEVKRREAEGLSKDGNQVKSQ